MTQPKPGLNSILQNIPISGSSVNEALTPENAVRLSEKFIQAIEPCPTHFQGRGIVIAAGGLRYFTNAWVCVKMLRHLGCQLPVQLWHFGAEIDDIMRAVIEPLGVECVDASGIDAKPRTRNLVGYALKPYAIVKCPFREVLLLDADNVPVVNPEFLFETEQFSRTGAIFWPDFGRFAKQHPIWRICGIEFRDEPEFESGQIAIDKERCWEPLNLCTWYNEHANFYYRYILGDKDTFHLAFRKLGFEYSMPSKPLHALRGTMCQHDFEGTRIFQHRNLEKWALFSENSRIEGFLYEKECIAFIAELRQLLAGHWGWLRYNFSSKPLAILKVAGRIIGRKFIYHRVGYDHRLMTFNEDGTIGIGGAGCEIFWDLREESDGIVLQISTDTEITCQLTEDPHGVWRGRWLHHERMPVEVSPCVGNPMNPPDLK